MDSPWTQLSHIPGKVTRPPKIMTPHEMLAPLTKKDSQRIDDKDNNYSATNESSLSSTNITNTGDITNTNNVNLPPVADDDSDVVPNPPPYIEHTVTKSDTLFGLSLKYGIHISEIKLLNDLATDNISYLKYLKIPQGKHRQPVLPDKSNLPDSKRTLLRKFKNTYNVSEKEAKYYLDMVDYNYDEAVKEYEQDLQFEQKHQPEIQKVLQPIIASTVNIVPSSSASTNNNRSSSSSNQSTNKNNSDNPTLLTKLNSLLPSSSSSARSTVPSSYASSPHEIEPLTSTMSTKNMQQSTINSNTIAADARKKDDDLPDKNSLTGNRSGSIIKSNGGAIDWPSSSTDSTNNGGNGIFSTLRKRK